MSKNTKRRILTRNESGANPSLVSLPYSSSRKRRTRSPSSDEPLIPRRKTRGKIPFAPSPTKPNRPPSSPSPPPPPRTLSPRTPSPPPHLVLTFRLPILLLLPLITPLPLLLPRLQHPLFLLPPPLLALQLLDVATQRFLNLLLSVSTFATGNLTPTVESATVGLLLLFGTSAGRKTRWIHSSQRSGTGRISQH